MVTDWLLFTSLIICGTGCRRRRRRRREEEEEQQQQQQQEEEEEKEEGFDGDGDDEHPTW